MSRVAFIDDDHGPIDYYVEALTEKGHEVEQFDNVEAFFSHLDQGKPADIYIVDIMMPTHGNPRLRESADGLASGVVLHREIRRLFPEVPIILLTSISNQEILDGLPIEPNTQVESKIDTLPFELANIVDEKLGR